MTDRPIACDVTVFTPEQRSRHDALASGLFINLSRVRELPDGYAVPIPLGRWQDAAEFVSLERLCCPFLTFILRLEPDSDTAWLEMGGSRDIKALLKSEFGLA